MVLITILLVVIAFELGFIVYDLEKFLPHHFWEYLNDINTSLHNLTYYVKEDKKTGKSKAKNK